MKTITEFTALTLKNAAKAQADLTAAGKTAEEMPQALSEAIKVEGDKLSLLMSALESVGTKLDDLKRVIVSTLNEGEKAPSHAKLKGEHYFTAEYYPPIAKKGAAPQGQHERGGKGRDGKRGDRKGKGRGGRGGRDDRKPRGDRPEGAPKEASERGPRGPRAPRPVTPSNGKKIEIKPKNMTEKSPTEAPKV